MATDLPLDPAPEIEQESTLREDIDAAFTEHATDEVDQPAGSDRARDAAGRFARQDADDERPTGKAPAGPQERATGQGGTQAPLQPAPAPGGELKAPASWTPAAREKWGSVDPDVRAEIHRRESESQRLLQDTAGLRQFTQQFQDVVRPYEMFIRSEGSDPLGAVQGLMNTAAELRVGTPMQKVAIVANIVRQHGIDLEMLDHHLAQQLGITEPGQRPQQLHDPRVDQLLQQQERWKWEQQQYLQQQDAQETQAIQQGLAAFAQAHEFYADVADTMADLVDAANKRGQQVNLEAIYQRACQLDPEVSTILAQRGGVQQPGRPGQQQTSQAVLRAKRAASSLRGDPNPQGSTVPKDDSVRASIEAAFDAHS